MSLDDRIYFESEVKVKTLSHVWLFATLWTVAYQGSPPIGWIFQARLLEWAAISFSRGSSRLRDQSQVSRIVGRCFTVWATREYILSPAFLYIFYNLSLGTSVAVQWLRFHVSNAGDRHSIPGLGRSPGKGNGSPLQYFCLENPLDSGAWWATLCGVTRVVHDSD